MPINYKRYPPTWKEIRARILERAGHCCELCGVPNHALITRESGTWQIVSPAIEELIEACGGQKCTKIVLTIAHLDHDAENWEVQDERLQALCQKCHLDYDRERHLRKRKYGMAVYKQPKLF